MGIVLERTAKILFFKILDLHIAILHVGLLSNLQNYFCFGIATAMVMFNQSKILLKNYGL